MQCPYWAGLGTSPRLCPMVVLDQNPYPHKYCIHFGPEDGSSMHNRNVCNTCCIHTVQRHRSRLNMNSEPPCNQCCVLHPLRHFSGPTAPACLAPAWAGGPNDPALRTPLTAHGQMGELLTEMLIVAQTVKPSAFITLTQRR
jgi:hypothetical protein